MPKLYAVRWISPEALNITNVSDSVVRIITIQRVSVRATS